VLTLPRRLIEDLDRIQIRLYPYNLWLKISEGLMSEENKQILRRWFDEVWNNGRADAIEELFDEKRHRARSLG
jgi:hypothetical protein